MFEKILFPVDASRETSHAISIVADLCRRYDSQVYVLSVLDDSRIEPDQLESTRSTIKALLQQTEAALRQVGLPEVQTLYREGKTAFIICDVADELDLNLIVMGSRGLGLMTEGADDSVSNRVINLAPCPVLVVP
jgi:nucleotide-binding universal stress UspA family protein